MKIILFILLLISYLWSQDINMDGLVNSSDLDSLRHNLGQSFSDRKDQNGNGRVDGIDYFIAAIHYGDSVIVSSPNADSIRIRIPELPSKTDSIRIEYAGADFAAKGSGTVLYNGTAGATFDNTYHVSSGTQYVTVFYYDNLYSWTGWTKGIGDTVTVAAGGSIFPLAISQDGHYLVDNTGKPFFLAIDTPWSLMVQSTYSEAEGYLDAMQSKGVTGIIVNSIEHAYADDAPNNQYGEGPFSTPGDFTTPNEDYWVYVDSVIAMAKTRGIEVLMTPAYLGWLCGWEGWSDEINSNGDTDCGTYGTWIGNRYKNYDNILWVKGGDALQSTCGTTSEYTAMFSGLLGQDTDGLHMYHASPNISGYESDNTVDINTTYCRDGSHYAEVLATYNLGIFPAIFLMGGCKN